LGGARNGGGGCARGELPGGRGGWRGPQARAGRRRPYRQRAQGRPGLAVRCPWPREPVRTAACPRPARQIDAADGPPGRARFARASRGTRHLGMHAAWGRVHGLGKARLGKERRGPEVEVAGHGARAIRESAARRRVPASPAAVYPGSTAIFSKILN
jgi:hypothetical protein